MPQPVRQSSSGALIFVPTKEEKLYLDSKRALDRELSEVRLLKEQLQQLLTESKGT